jgi:dTDP-4-amino-4,6-dideoxygalactose transaminase
MAKLALLGGDPVIAEALPPYQSMGEAEVAAVSDVVRSGCLSGFYGSPGPEFLGGPKVREFEDAWSERFGAKYTVSVNSASSGLMAAVGAVGVGPGDEVIVPPWTMSATAMAPLMYGGIPVFADIEDETFCLDPSHVKASITSKTRAIIVVNLFGHPARLAELRQIADDHNLFLIEDNAQAPLGHENGKPCGTVGHIGVFSLNFHKHIHTGEGGMCTTNNDGLAKRLQLIRNHGENTVEDWGIEDITNIIGMNLRMSELHAAVGIAQLGKADAHIESREKLAAALTEGTKDLEGWTPPVVRNGCRHNYYVWLPKFNEDIAGVSRDLFCKALAAEGFLHGVGYLPPLYTLPLFQKRQAIGREGFPFTLTDRSYQGSLCPVTERLHAKEAIVFEPCAFAVTDETTDLLINAVRKVHDNRAELKS